MSNEPERPTGRHSIRGATPDGARPNAAREVEHREEEPFGIPEPRDDDLSFEEAIRTSDSLDLHWDSRENTRVSEGEGTEN